MEKKAYTFQDWQNNNMNYPGRKKYVREEVDHWTDRLWTNKKFLKAIYKRFDITMFSFAELKELWYDTHPYWHTQPRFTAAYYGNRDPKRYQSKEVVLKEDEWLKATVGNFICKAVHQGDLIKICPGWYMLPYKEEE